jgi:hypothetical protein
VLEFRSSNTSHRPVIEALDLVQRYASSVKQFYPFAERVVLDGVVREDWRKLLLRTNPQGRVQVRGRVYEIAVFQALRDRLRCKEIWVVGADRWRNPDEDLPADFEEHRVEHDGRLGQPLDERVFVEPLVISQLAVDLGHSAHRVVVQHVGAVFGFQQHLMLLSCLGQLAIDQRRDRRQ